MYTLTYAFEELKSKISLETFQKLINVNLDAFNIETYYYGSKRKYQNNDLGLELHFSELENDWILDVIFCRDEFQRLRPKNGLEIEHFLTDEGKSFFKEFYKYSFELEIKREENKIKALQEKIESIEDNILKLQKFI